MKRILAVLLLGTILVLTACKSKAKASANELPLETTLDEKNRQAISLLNRIRKLPGMTIRGGIPLFSKGSNSLSSIGQPLYILNDYIMGNSFSSVNSIVESVNVKKIEALSAADASFYGSRAANGVIKITTYQ